MSFLKEAVKNASEPLRNPFATLSPGFYKRAFKVTEHTGEYFKPPRAPKPTMAQLALEASQLEQLSKTNEQENLRRKRMLYAVEGPRAYRGSSLYRATPGSSAADSLLGPEAQFGSSGRL